MRRSAALGLCALLAACSEPDYYAFSSNQTGSRDAPPGFTAVVIWISDSPLDQASSVLVTIDRVELVGATGPRVLSDRSCELDLLALRDGREALLAEAEVEAGTYERLTIHLGGFHRMVARGHTHPLPASEEVIEVWGPFVLEDGERFELHVDFDVRASVVEASGGGWLLRPLIFLR
ncbi:MAG: DUF4382 domain-containing protein [Planctomycetota bacterium]|jgi:hypothetical protein